MQDNHLIGSNIVRLKKERSQEIAATKKQKLVSDCLKLEFEQRLFFLRLSDFLKLPGGSEINYKLQGSRRTLSLKPYPWLRERWRLLGKSETQVLHQKKRALTVQEWHFLESRHIMQQGCTRCDVQRGELRATATDTENISEPETCSLTRWPFAVKLRDREESHVPLPLSNGYLILTRSLVEFATAVLCSVLSLIFPFFFFCWGSSIFRYL